MISIVDVVNACKGTTRPLREGEQYFKSGLLVCVGVEGKNGDIVKCAGLAAQTSGIFAYPHELEAFIDTSAEDGSKVTSVKCSCPAGESSQCKHCISMLLYLNRIDEDDLDDLTCTDLKQQWGKLKETHYQAYQAKLLSELCDVEKVEEVDRMTISEETKKKWKTLLMNCK